MNTSTDTTLTQSNQPQTNEKDCDFPEDGFDLENALSKLENIVSSLEQGNLKLSQALKAYESGMNLSKQCEQALKEAKQRVYQISESGQPTPAQDLTPET